MLSAAGPSAASLNLSSVYAVVEALALSLCSGSALWGPDGSVAEEQSHDLLPPSLSRAPKHSLVLTPC